MHPLQERKNELNEAAFHLAGAEIPDQANPLVMPLVLGVAEDREEHQAFDVDIGPPGASDHVLELGDLDLLAMPIERMHDDRRRRERGR